LKPPACACACSFGSSRAWLDASSLRGTRPLRKRNTMMHLVASYGPNYLGGAEKPRSASPRARGQTGGKRNDDAEKKKEELQGKGVEGMRAVGCRLLPCQLPCTNWEELGDSALSVVGNGSGLVLQTPSQSGAPMAPAPSLGFGSSEAMGWGALIGPSGQCAKQHSRKFRRTLPVSISEQRCDRLRQHVEAYRRGGVEGEPCFETAVSVSDARHPARLREVSEGGRQASADLSACVPGWSPGMQCRADLQ
jgi:hypothetical protein